MTQEQDRLLRENNIMLKQILASLHGSTGKEFMINVLANLTADGLQNKSQP
jgi:hypothetical protein